MDDSSSDFDTAWKQALEWFFEPFLAFFFPSIHRAVDWSREPEFLDKELQQIVPEAEAGRGTVDKLVKVWTPEGIEAWVLVHIEVQSQHDPAFAERMYTYNHRLTDRYGQMPVSLAVLGDESMIWRPDHYTAGRWECDVQFTFPTVKLVDYKKQETTLQADVNPFAVIILAHLKAQETRGDVASRLGWKLRLVKGLYDRGLTQVQVALLFRLIEWVIKLPPVPAFQFERELHAFEEERKMELITQTEQIWKDRGLQQGLQQGLQRAIELGLKRRFGQSGLDLLPRVQTVADKIALESLLEAVDTVSDLEAFRKLLPPQA